MPKISLLSSLDGLPSDFGKKIGDAIKKEIDFPGPKVLYKIEINGGFYGRLRIDFDYTLLGSPILRWEVSTGTMSSPSNAILEIPESAKNIVAMYEVEVNLVPPTWSAVQVLQQDTPQTECYYISGTLPSNIHVQPCSS